MKVDVKVIQLVQELVVEANALKGPSQQLQRLHLSEAGLVAVLLLVADVEVVERVYVTQDDFSNNLVIFGVVPDYKFRLNELFCNLLAELEMLIKFADIIRAVGLNFFEERQDDLPRYGVART